MRSILICCRRKAMELQSVHLWPRKSFDNKRGLTSRDSVLFRADFFLSYLILLISLIYSVLTLPIPPSPFLPPFSPQIPYHSPLIPQHWFLFPDHSTFITPPSLFTSHHWSLFPLPFTPHHSFLMLPKSGRPRQENLGSLQQRRAAL